MRILICTKYDLAGNLALNRLVRALAPRHDLHVILSDYVLKEERSNRMAACLLRHERDLMHETVFPFLNDSFAPEHARQDSHFLTFEALSAAYGIPVTLRGRIALPESAEYVRSLSPDMIISCRYDYIFRSNVISVAPLGIYGLHPGALPGVRGLCSPFRAMLLGHVRSGCTLFHVDEGLDTGDIVDIGWAPISKERSMLWTFVHTYFAGIEALRRHLPELERGNRLRAAPQVAADQHYYAYPTENEFRQFMDQGGMLVTRKDYLELLALYLPGGMADPHLARLRELTSPCEC